MTQALYILIAFLLFAALFERLRIGSIFGLLIAGAAIGPWGAGLIDDIEAVSALAELGVVFLLFNLGLELKLDRIRLFGPRIYALALLQIAATTTALAALAQVLGLGLEASIVVGMALALSSTALVLRILSDLGRTVTQLGRLAVAILLVQDLAVGPLLVAANLLGEGSGIGETVVTFAIGAVASIAIVVLVSRFALPSLLRQVAMLDVPELFMAATLLIVLAASWATEHAGLSAALGAFLAGLMLADTEYRHQIAADLSPFRGLFLGLFFMTVGMKADLGIVIAEPVTIAGVTVGLVLAKGVLLVAVTLALGYRFRLAAELGVLLSQGSEFSFVVLGVAVGSGLVAGPFAAAITVAVAFSMIVTPAVAALARRYIDRSEGPAVSALDELEEQTAEIGRRVVVLGFGQVGRALTRYLVGLKIGVLALDYDPRLVRAASQRKIPVFYGNATRSDVLRAVHIERASLVVVALSDSDVALQVVSLVHRMAPRVRILARAPDGAVVAELREAGAHAVVLDSLTTALDLAERAVVLVDPSPEPAPARAARPATDSAG